MMLVVLGCLLAAGAQASGYRIAGVVVNAATREAVSGARVTIAPVERPDERLGFVTGSDGRFAFVGMPGGRYELMGEQRGLLAGAYQQHGSLSTAIVTGPGKDTGNLVLELSPPGIISGTVTDEGGDPVEHARAELWSSTIVDGRRRLTALADKQTDDTGEFRFASLEPGSYYLAVSGYPWYTKLSQMFAGAPSRGITHTGYSIKYYPNTSDPGAAAPLVLQAGQELSADFTLVAAPAAAIHVHTEGGETLVKEFTLTTPGIGGEPVLLRQGSESGELHNFWGVPAGHYTVGVHGSDAGGAMYGSTEVDLGDSDADVTVTLADAPSLIGTMQLEGGGGLPEGISVTLADAGGRTQRLPVDASGKFALASIAPQRYRLALAGAKEYHLERWAVEGARRDGEMLDIRAGSAVRLWLVAGKGSGQVRGVVSRDGHALPGALVVLAPGHAVQTDSDGSYEFRNLPAGEYALFAVEDGTELEYAKASAIQPYLKAAQKVRVTAGHAETRAIALQGQ
jgi:Carboxypeptidase regulatory-like domain